MKNCHHGVRSSFGGAKGTRVTGGKRWGEHESKGGPNTGGAVRDCSQREEIGGFEWVSPWRHGGGEDSRKRAEHVARQRGNLKGQGGV